MKPFRAMQTAGLLKGLLRLGCWAIVVLVPVYVALVVIGYLRSGEPDMALGADVWFNPAPVAWALEGDGSRAARLRKLGWALILVELVLASLRMAEGLSVAWQFERPGLEQWPFRLDVPVTGLFVGAVLLVAAEAFRRGAQLEADQALTV
jgi:hypothetical protein